jgi:hypothetical protein
MVPIRLTYEALARNPELPHVVLPQARRHFTVRVFAWLIRRLWRPGMLVEIMVTARK